MAYVSILRKIQTFLVSWNVSLSRETPKVIKEKVFTGVQSA